jgi:hypothetical protein
MANSADCSVPGQDVLPSCVDKQDQQLATAVYLTTHSILIAVSSNILQIRETELHLEPPVLIKWPILKAVGKSYFRTIILSKVIISPTFLWDCPFNRFIV